MIIKLLAYEDEFHEDQDKPKIEIIMHEPSAEDFASELKDFAEVVELELEEV